MRSCRDPGCSLRQAPQWPILHVPVSAHSTCLNPHPDTETHGHHH